MIAAAILTLVVIAYRVILGILGASHLDWLHNFSPLAAVALCGAIFFPRKLAVALPIGALFVSDLLLNVFAYHVSPLNVAMVPQYLALGLVSALGWMLRDRPQTWKVFLASVGGTVLFYVLTNTGAWLFTPEAGPLTKAIPYAKTFQGWVQALTVGLPGFPPTYTFLKHSLISDLIFTGLFLECLHLTRARGHAEAAEHAEEHGSLRAEFARRLR